MPTYDLRAPLHFLINGASGRAAAQAKLELIEAALGRAGREGVIQFVTPQTLDDEAAQAARAAVVDRGAIVAVGGDGTINAVAQAAHRFNCPLGVVAQGTFNYFARTHQLPTEPDEAADALFNAMPVPVQVGSVNDRRFLVNASLGLYPELLEDREAWKLRFGRSRLVALAAALATIAAAPRRLRLRIEEDGAARDVRTATLFVGNNRLQMDQVGLPEAPVVGQGRLAAVMLRPMGSLALLGLLLRGAFGRLGDADTVHSFDFERLVVRPARGSLRRRFKVAFDGEIEWMRGPLVFEVSPRPLYLLKPQPQAGGAAEANEATPTPLATGA
jgi:diacylglycerol kinase family enzyme